MTVPDSNTAALNRHLLNEDHQISVTIEQEDVEQVIDKMTEFDMRDYIQKLVFPKQSVEQEAQELVDWILQQAHEVKLRKISF